MPNDAVNASYEKMAQDAMDDQAPRPKSSVRRALS